MMELNKIYKKYQEIIHYCIAGALTTVVNIVSFYFLKDILLIPYLISNLFAILLSIFFAYFINKKYVFQSITTNWKDTLQEFMHFISLRLISGLFDMLSMYMLIEYLNIEMNLSKIITQLIIVISNYLFSKLFIFKNK